MSYIYISYMYMYIYICICIYIYHIYIYISVYITYVSYIYIYIINVFKTILSYQKLYINHAFSGRMLPIRSNAGPVSIPILGLGFESPEAEIFWAAEWYPPKWPFSMGNGWENEPNGMGHGVSYKQPWQSHFCCSLDVFGAVGLGFKCSLMRFWVMVEGFFPAGVLASTWLGLEKGDTRIITQKIAIWLRIIMIAWW